MKRVTSKTEYSVNAGNGKHSLYPPRPIKRKRRTDAELDDMLAAIQTILDGEENRITIRHLFYRLVSSKVIEKTQAAYKLMGGHLARWRRAGRESLGHSVSEARQHRADGRPLNNHQRPRNDYHQ